MCYFLDFEIGIPQYKYCLGKNAKLKEARGVGFEEVASSIENGGLLEVKPHYNQWKYAKQYIATVKMNNYAYLVPFELDSGFVVFKTIIPSRKATRKLLKSEVRNEGKSPERKALSSERI